MEPTALTENKTQDFVLLSSDYFFTSQLHGYASVQTATSGKFIDFFKWTFNSINPFNWNLKPVARIVKMFRAGKKVSNPLDETYYSTTPYRLGSPDLAVKWSAVPCETNNFPETFERTGADFLRHNLADTLHASGVCFDFRVQEQRDACVNKVEDVTTPWKGEWISVAKIYIPKVCDTLLTACSLLRVYGCARVCTRKSH